MDLPPALDDAFVSTLAKRVSQYREPIPNDISQVRDHYANERSFLAWLKLSLSFFGLGIGVLSQRASLKNAVPSSVAALIASVTFLVFATWRYFKARHILVTGFDDPMADAVRLFFAITLLCIVSYAIFTFVPEFAV